jgi:hypothetical protein
MRTAVRTTRAIHQPGVTLSAPALSPLVRRLTGNVHRLSRRSDRHPAVNPVDEFASTPQRQQSITVHSSLPGFVCCLRQLHTRPWGSLNSGRQQRPRAQHLDGQGSAPLGCATHEVAVDQLGECRVGLVAPQGVNVGVHYEVGKGPVGSLAAGGFVGMGRWAVGCVSHTGQSAPNTGASGHVVHLVRTVLRTVPDGELTDLAETGPELDLSSALGGTRTPNLLIRSQMLYPIELRAQEPHLRRGVAACPKAVP